jgi:hypothetical protein
MTIEPQSVGANGIRPTLAWLRKSSNCSPSPPLLGDW